MSDNHSEEHHEEQHIGIRGYLGVFGILVVGTIVTYYIALSDLDSSLFHGANTLVALLIAFFKMSCVMLFFMHGPRVPYRKVVCSKLHHPVCSPGRPSRCLARSADLSQRIQQTQRQKPEKRNRRPRSKRRISQFGNAKTE